MNSAPKQHDARVANVQKQVRLYNQNIDLDSRCIICIGVDKGELNPG